ncbi:MAG: hypothetical protein DRJ41_03140 [Thermoprotei archaeon]|nr:MAG: hypothetical protein DRJ41_03140 [Thermoprotei archaeon]
MAKLKVVFESIGEVLVELTDKNPKTRDAFLNSVPFESTASRWGDEIYFSTPVRMGLEVSQETVEKGDVAYWPPGRAMCIFFGPTPASRSPDEIRPASPVNVFGRVTGNLDKLKSVKDGERVRVELAEQ